MNSLTIQMQAKMSRDVIRAEILKELSRMGNLPAELLASIGGKS